MKSYTEIPAPTIINEAGVPIGIGLKAYNKGDVFVVVSQQVMDAGVEHGGRLRWHISISCRERYPTWDEIRDARYALLPDDCTMAMLLPPKREYVNVHPNCFHLHEIV